MPTNLNALIRYKTINSCLYGGNRRWSIPELMEKCSEALAEFRGRYDPVSERTIRDDIRVMRSDILGYNAPIVQKDGMYFYSDPGYSIMSVTFTDSALIKKIIKLLNDLKHEVSHPELELILSRLNAMTYYESAIPVEKPKPVKRQKQNISKAQSMDRIQDFSELRETEPDYLLYHEVMDWQEIFNVLRTE